MVRALGVIPARFGSTRFPGKPLASLGRRILIEEVWSRVSAARSLSRVVVATDDARIAEACRSFGAEAELTSADHVTGTDRVAEIALKVGRSCDVVVNVQGDEPLVTPTSVDRLVGAFSAEKPPAMATLAEPLESVEDLLDPNVVKVVTALNGDALYFSRSPIPYYRGGQSGSDLAAALASRPGVLSGYLRHQGIYAYRKETLLALTRIPPSPLERDEELEQLRALQAGLGIRVIESDFHSVGVDTPADLERVAALLAQSARAGRS